MKRFNIVVVLVVMLALCYSCKKKSDPTDQELGFSYFPITVGDFYVYEVIDTVFQGVGVFQIAKYFVKEEVHKTITINDEVRYQLYLYYRTVGEDWKEYPDSNWTVFNDKRRIVRVEDNVRYVKLVFPLVPGSRWDGQISDPSNDSQDYYTMKEVERPFTLETTYYPETVSVVQFDNRSVIDDNYAIEVYANGIGLVYKQIRVYKYDQTNLLAKNVELGKHYVKKLIEYGKYN